MPESTTAAPKKKNWEKKDWKTLSEKDDFQLKTFILAPTEHNKLDNQGNPREERPMFRIQWESPFATPMTDTQTGEVRYIRKTKFEDFTKDQYDKLIELLDKAGE
jgi:hypothetical protein